MKTKERDMFLAVGGSMHGKLLEDFGSRTTHVAIFPTFLDIKSPEEIVSLEQEIYHLRLWRLKNTRRVAQYFVLEGLSDAETLRLINEIEKEEEIIAEERK